MGEVCLEATDKEGWGLADVKRSKLLCFLGFYYPLQPSAATLMLSQDVDHDADN